jgi:hypothetical protein
MCLHPASRAWATRRVAFPSLAVACVVDVYMVAMVLDRGCGCSCESEGHADIEFRQ